MTYLAASKKLGVLFLILIIGGGGYTYLTFDSASKTNLEITEISFFNVNLETKVVILTITWYGNTTGYIPLKISTGEYNLYIEGLFLRKGTLGDLIIDQDGENYQASINLDDDYMSEAAKVEYLAFLSGSQKTFKIELVSAKFTVLTLPLSLSQNISVAGYNV